MSEIHVKSEAQLREIAKEGGKVTDIRFGNKYSETGIDATWVKDDHLKLIAEKFPNLKILRPNYCVNITSPGLHHIFCLKWEKLGIGCCKQLFSSDEAKNKTFAALNKLTSLEDLYLGGCGLKDEHLKLLSSDLANLRTLGLRYNPEITDACLLHLVRFPLLSFDNKDTYEGTKITHAGLDAFKIQQQDINAAKKKIADLTQKLAEANDKIEELNNSNADLTQQLAVATKSNSDLTNDSAKSSTKIADLNKKNADLVQQLDVSKKSAQTEAADFKKRLQELETKNSTLAQQLKETREKLQVETAEKQRAESAASKSAAEVSELTRQLELAEVKRANGTSELKKQIAQLKNNGAALKEEINTATKKIADLTQKLTNDSAKSSSTIAEVNKQNAELINKIAEVNKKIAELNDKIAELNNKNADLIQKFAEATDKVDVANTNRETSKKESFEKIAALQDQLDQQVERFAEKEQKHQEEIAARDRKILALQKTLGNIFADVQSKISVGERELCAIATNTNIVAI